jgi:lactate dehydrogenase-like 2-hydroxyacid dehydrogenase
MRILIPDLFYADADVEREAAGADVDIDFCLWEPGVPTIIGPERWNAADALVLYEKYIIGPEIMAMLTQCRLVVRAGVGFDNVDIKGWGARGVPVCNVPDYGTMDVAEHAMGLMLALTRGIVSHDRNLKTDPIHEWNFKKPPLIRRLQGQKVGIIGLGRIGTALARRLRAFGAEVWFYDPYRPTGTELAMDLKRADTLEELVALSDIISMHTPLTAETRNMINKETLAHAKANLLLINTGRGECVHLDDLYESLKSNAIEGAALDVQWKEPPDPEHPLIKGWANREPWIDDRLIFTPHSAFYSPSSIVSLRRKSIEVAMSFLKHGRLKNCVNEPLIS